MTINFGKYNFSVNVRNGVGLDLEFTDTRAVWVCGDDIDGFEAAQFAGIVLCVPFLVLTFGKVYMEV